ncbi:hypothetical protein BIV57_19795 [Mangrovactinospora gilvigrisea]|uniref:ABC transporter domain-containing protein n=1 Tax=Mangrovactinospora gilvigrisea TaxID=1428644 RepID=A0A1J7C2H2_9ACTN|nr:ABC transporter ATP-binding protein [Mangrovactinospora gilvigrisea]OIV35772.1 hypothetical protein BIV57_19795 [Mangrovactinospora gilvigrisea]
MDAETDPVAGPEIAVRMRAVRRVHGFGARAVTALDRVSVDFPEGAWTALLGPSGAGKSALLRCAAGLDRPTAGSVEVDGEDLLVMRRRERARYCRARIAIGYGAAVLGWRPDDPTLPRLLLVDEPTAGFDAAAARRILERLRELVASGRTVVTAGRDPEAAWAADRVVLMEGGRRLHGAGPSRVGCAEEGSAGRAGSRGGGQPV